MADAAAKKAVDAKKKKDAADAKDKEEELTPEELAAKAEEEKKKAEEEAKKKAAAEAKKKAEAEAKAKKEAEELATAVACLSDAKLVLLKTGRLNAPPATVTERIDYLRDQGIPEKAIKAATAECGAQEPDYARDAWGRIIATNDVKYNPNAKPPPADGFGQMRGEAGAWALGRR